MTDAASRSRRALQAHAKDHRNPGAPRPATSEQRRFEAHRVAEDLYRQKPDWMTFFREILGVGGVVPRLFPTHEERAAFERTPEFADVQRMLTELRSQGSDAAEAEDREPTRVITVRLPKSMHEALRAEAYSRQISINKLCIAKLLKSLEEAEAEAARLSDGDDE
jgi:hypothetical protein